MEKDNKVNVLPEETVKRKPPGLPDIEQTEEEEG
jgi:hypothetical protein